MTQREQFSNVLDRLKTGKLSKPDAQRLVDALSSWADKRLPDDLWDEVVTLERTLFGTTLQEQGQAR